VNQVTAVMKSQQFLPARPVTISPYVLIKEVAGMQEGAGASPSSGSKSRSPWGGAGP